MSARDELRKYVSLQGDCWTPPERTAERVERLYSLVRNEVLRAATSELEQARGIAVELENENARLSAELEKYVGKEPTVAEEMQYLSGCLSAVRDLCELARHTASRWENPLPVPEWVTAVEQAAAGHRPDNPDDRRRRIYIDGEGDPWIDQSVDETGARYIVPAIAAGGEADKADDIRTNTGGLTEIGRVW